MLTFESFFEELKTKQNTETAVTELTVVGYIDRLVLNTWNVCGDFLSHRNKQTNKQTNKIAKYDDACL